MSDDLIAFLKAWHDWATGGAADDEPFSRAMGLCGNAFAMFEDEEVAEDVRGELFAIFGESEFPFGNDYFERSDACGHHQCPKRLTWVREKLVEAGEPVQ